ncbi:MAG: hypothetical protein ACD_22C00256G0008 [uncultured bacterium]|uniref:Uncharacterized protein n=1 Tax=candidate division WWE3 bacterium RBG_16_37_10 TaxID=1802610 RepID=A0A1F4UXV1_UNCKA|nr:MAG: hypothetical protein ACD_22C00256G0008 [uncultured bacterium]OGC49732.1 MAG: hypothetical protein A2W32_05315 [candidate division WWE3 bacterium RBG_16_37_10]
MNKIYWGLLLVSYIILVYVFSTTNIDTHAVTNPGFSDYLAEGFGGTLASFILTSVVTLPLQYISGWNKVSYLRKTIKGMLIVSFICLLPRLV